MVISLWKGLCFRVLRRTSKDSYRATTLKCSNCFLKSVPSKCLFLFQQFIKLKCQVTNGSALCSVFTTGQKFICVVFNGLFIDLFVLSVGLFHK